jgi:multidrug efflux pump subunit AcrA (membrane-fusion protein)
LAKGASGRTRVAARQQEKSDQAALDFTARSNPFDRAVGVVAAPPTRWPGLTTSLRSAC